MSAEILNVTAQVVRNASIVSKAKALATAHPIGAAAVATVTVGLAGWGTWKIGRSLFRGKSKPVQIAAAPVAAPQPAPVTPVAPAAS